MKTIIKHICVLLGMLIGMTALPLGAESLRISQIDSSSLLLNQDVSVYVSITDDKGEPIDNIPSSKFSIYESADGKNFKRIPEINSFKTMANFESGINFLLLIDNSGSMYRDMQGRKVSSDSKARIGNAKKAVKIFLKSISNPKDRVGLASYNTNFMVHSEPIADKGKVERLLDDIRRPGTEERYTEIYASLDKAVEEFRSVKGRKAIIILSDGANQPYYQYTKKLHPVFGNKIYKYTEPIQSCQEEGISVFAINFGRRGEQKDKKLKDVAIETGGSVFDAHNEYELTNVYSRIVKQILHEYLITYDATMQPADRKYVQVKYDSPSGEKAATRFYFSSTVFGLPLQNFSMLLLLPFLLAFALAWLLSRLKFEMEKREPSLEVLNRGSAKAVTQVLTLNKKGKTVIGGSAKADMTILGGVTSIKEQHATIAFNEKTKKYTLVGQAPVKVNNKNVSTKVLESGDVINVGGTTIVFDDGDV